MKHSHRFSVQEYHTLIQSGLLTEDDELELLEGYLVHKVDRSPEHDRVIQRSNRRLMGLLPAGWDLRIQSAITLPDSEPEPDIAVVRGDDSRYEIAIPAPRTSVCSLRRRIPRWRATAPTRAAFMRGPASCAIGS
jgi:hypothetical protein